MRNVIRYIGLSLLIGLFLTSCKKVEEEEKTYRFGATYMTMNNPYFVALNNGIKDVVEANGDTLMVLDPALDNAKQIEQIEDLIASKVDAIFLNPADWVAIKPALLKAKAAGIPIINVDSPVFDKDLVDCIIASDNYNTGVICANDMMEKLDQAKIVILEHPTAKSAIDRTQGFIDTVAGLPGYEIVAVGSSLGQLEHAMPVMEEIIKEVDQIDVVMALNDPTAMGALAALQAANRDQGVLIYGVDGAPEAKQMIVDGKMTATAAQSPSTIGAVAANVAYDLLRGQAIEKEILIDVIFVDQSNVLEYGTVDWQ